MIISKPFEDHHNPDVQRKAKKQCRKAHNKIRDILVELIKYASDPDFVLKNVEIADDEDFKFLQIK